MGEGIMEITATEFKTNFGRYLDMVNTENIYITKNGKVVAQLTRPQVNKLELLSSLIGIVPNGENIDLDEIRSERLKKQ